jgi:hypothetical protein
MARLLLAAIAAVATASPLDDVPAAFARSSSQYRSGRPSASLPPALEALLPGMWAQANAADAAAKHAPGGTGPAMACAAAMLQYELSLRLQPERAPLLDVFDALQLGGQGSACGVTPPPGSRSTLVFEPLSAAQLQAQCTVGPFYVDPLAGSDSNAGTLASPFQSLTRALGATRTGRTAPGAGVPCVVLRGGTHFLNATLLLGAGDSGLIVTAYDGASEPPAWVSGGVPLGPQLAWTPYNTSASAGMNVWKTTLPASVPPLQSMPGLNTLDGGDASLAAPTRLFRARFPQGYNQEFFSGPLPDMHELVSLDKPAPTFGVPEIYYKDLQALGLFNASSMRAYNVYVAARGGVCGHWDTDTPDEWAYACSNDTAGGWEEVERGFAMTGQLGFPVSATYNASRLPSRVATWTVPVAPGGPTDWSNTPVFTLRHNQGWYEGFYAVTAISGTTFNLSADGTWPAGGWQGGRTMQNCNPNNLTIGEPLCGGNWYVSNVFQELDEPGEYFFDVASRTLYFFYNATSGTPPPSTLALVAPQLEVFFNLTGDPSSPVTDVTFAGLGFRDQRNAQLDRWIDPSGGDWGLRRAGLFHFEGTERVTVSGSTFYRTDANAIFLAAYNRNATVVDNEFVFTGMSAVVTFGRTVQDDGTGNLHPWGTVIAYNKVHELGTFELQSSAWFTARAALTRAEGNIIFNVPRAAINLQDGFGGNYMVSNSIFNTCRQSGDHGPINSWQRMPLMSTVGTMGALPTYAQLPTDTSHNMIIANYGASQGFDNDDGSSYYTTHDNFFFDAAGFKMDYGGHDSQFENNVVVAYSGQNCIGTASFVSGHADRYHDNDCIVYNTERVDDLFENCDTPSPGQEMLHGYNNRYYTPLANASATCDCCGLRPLAQLPAGLATNFTSSPLPSSAVVIAMGRGKLLIPAL